MIRGLPKYAEGYQKSQMLQGLACTRALAHGAYSVNYCATALSELLVRTSTQFAWQCKLESCYLVALYSHRVGLRIQVAPPPRWHVRRYKHAASLSISVQMSGYRMMFERVRIRSRRVRVGDTLVAIH